MKKKCPRCNREFDAEQRFCPGDGTALRFSNSVEIRPGDIIGERYEIREKLGVGGMGVVYLTNDVRLDRLCALKVLSEDALADVGAVARFHREATNASRIQHPNTVTIYNFDETDDRLTYLAMEYVEGETLAALLARTPVLSARATGRIVWQIANALGAAHELKIVHRDLKPGNIMITRYRQWRDFVKVVDFGIAKAFGTSTGDGITTRGTRIGTPEYMSPEQWLSNEVDHRSDIFSLGLITIRMLAGGFPTADRTAPTPPGRKLMDALPPNDWPPALTDVLTRCIAERPEDRFQTASDFAAAFVAIAQEWEPPVPGVREPWEARVGPGSPTQPGTEDRAPATDDDATIAAPVAPSSSPRTRRRWRPLLFVAIATPLLVLSGMWSIDRLSSSSNFPSQSTGADSLPAATASADDSASATAPVSPAESVGTSVPVTSGQPPPVDPDPQPPSQAQTSSFLVERLVSLLSDPPDPDSVRYAISLATTLLERELSDSMRIEVTTHLAEGELLTGADSVACDRLHRLEPATRATGFFARPVAALLSQFCDRLE